MVKSVEELEQQALENSRRALMMFVDKCEEFGLNKTSIAALLGVSRQSLKNYQDGKSPNRGVIVRVKLVYPLIQSAETAGLLPLGSRREQSAIVEQILNQ